MEAIKISQESLDAFKSGERLIPAPIDNKNLLEDSFEDDVFDDFYAAKDHRDGSHTRHLFGTLNIETDDLYVDGLVEVKWNFGSHTIVISLVAVPPTEDFEQMRNDCYTYYENLFKSWECEENEYLRVKFSRMYDNLFVKFFFVSD